MIREIHPEETGKLYEFLEASAEHHNKVSVHLKGRYGNEAIHLYEKYGFREKSVILALHR